jgi:hypothetical protein
VVGDGWRYDGVDVTRSKEGICHQLPRLKASCPVWTISRVWTLKQLKVAAARRHQTLPFRKGEHAAGKYRTVLHLPPNLIDLSSDQHEEEYQNKLLSTIK